MTTAIEYSDVQGNILAGYKFLFARHIFVCGDRATLQSCLSALADLVTTAESDADWRRRSSAVNVAVTYSGFQVLGLTPALLNAFPAWFRQPMSERAASLGDVGASAPDHWEDQLGTGRWHLLVTVSARDRQALAKRVAELKPLLPATAQVAQDVFLNQDRKEHFGFADGSAQPDIEGVERSRDRSERGGGVPMHDGGWRRLKVGEFLLGYPDEDGVPQPRANATLTRNGSYVVYRRLEQNVAAFEAALTAAAAATGLDEYLLRAKIIGRWPNGTPIEVSPRSSADPVHAAHPTNDFRFLPHDRDGHSCPLGAHVRRANPRDALDLNGTLAESGASTARHRILRRGMLYGPEGGAAGSRGLAFVCYNADTERQFEVIQQQWLRNGDPFGLGLEVDFLFAPAGATMTIPQRDERPVFVSSPGDLVVTRGSEYLFAPGIAALRSLGRGDCS